MGRADERVSPLRRQELIAALRRGTVPRRDLGLLAVGLERFEEALEDELAAARRGSAVFKAGRGEYGTGKTFLSRWLQERALRQGFAAAEVQVSETETPLHRLETVYRRSMERLATADCPAGALRNVLDAWFYALEGDAAEALGDGAGQEAVEEKVGEVLESRLAPATPGSRETSTTSARSPSSGGCCTCCGTPATPGWCWCSTRWRPCSGCAATCASVA